MLSSRPADSLEELALKSSYPSPPLIMSTSRLEPVPAGRGAVVVEGEVPEPFSLVLSCVPSFGTSTAVRKRTCPVCPWKDAVADGQFRREAVLAVIVGSGNVNTTPALVPIQSRSLHASRAVTRKQAALCWRMIASEPTETKTAALTICFTHPHKSAKDHGRVRMFRSVSVCLFVCLFVCFALVLRANTSGLQTKGMERVWKRRVVLGKAAKLYTFSRLTRPRARIHAFGASTVHVSQEFSSSRSLSD